MEETKPNDLEQSGACKAYINSQLPIAARISPAVAQLFKPQTMNCAKPSDKRSRKPPPVAKKPVLSEHLKLLYSEQNDENHGSNGNYTS